jgi:cbb3-type cytochrome oxidase subunit 3
MESQWLFNLILMLQFVILIAVVVWAFRLSKRLERVKLHHAEVELNQKKQVQVLASGSIGMGRRLVAIEKKLNLAVEKQSEILSKEGGVSYNRAMELLEMGATIDDLVSKCGLIRAEAELISLLKQESRRNSDYH